MANHSVQSYGTIHLEEADMQMHKQSSVAIDNLHSSQNEPRRTITEHNEERCISVACCVLLYPGRGFEA